ncbi:MAG: TerB family tellurite resistance protein, partial [Deltaproteobacteria bacterium]|nr:TerB family tellurite resistance protein [Deltaproteobacteria bacterium]
GQVLHDLFGSARERVTTEDLLRRFENLRRQEQLSGSVDALLRGAKGANELMAVFEAIAAVDQHIDAREIALIEAFVTRWHLPSPKLKEGATETDGDVLVLRESVERYLAISPPAEQATELLDVLYHFVNADEEVSQEEQIVMDEITAMVMGYVMQSGDHGGHEVVIVPQNEEQIAKVKALFPGIEATLLQGGSVYSVGRFFSSKFADSICEKYVALGFFTTRIEV